MKVSILLTLILLCNGNSIISFARDEDRQVETKTTNENKESLSSPKRQTSRQQTPLRRTNDVNSNELIEYNEVHLRTKKKETFPYNNNFLRDHHQSPRAQPGTSLRIPTTKRRSSTTRRILDSPNGDDDVNWAEVFGISQGCYDAILQIESNEVYKAASDQANAEIEAMIADEETHCLTNITMDTTTCVFDLGMSLLCFWLCGIDSTFFELKYQQ